MITIEKVTTCDHLLQIARQLINEYAIELDVDLGFQNVDKELENPLIKYGPPNGALFVAFYKNEPTGCIALQCLEPKQRCEMKRLFIKPECRKAGIGKLLTEKILEEAKLLGYRIMVLDTLEKLSPAIKLYTAAGFMRTDPYYFNPLPGVIFMKKKLR